MQRLRGNGEQVSGLLNWTIQIRDSCYPVPKSLDHLKAPMLKYLKDVMVFAKTELRTVRMDDRLSCPSASLTYFVLGKPL